mgnify:CR=1 FL=1
MIPRLHNRVVEAAVAAAGIVTLLATVVGLHDHGVGGCGHIARSLDLAVQSCGDMPQQRIQGNSQSSFRIDSLGMLSTARR